METTVTQVGIDWIRILINLVIFITILGTLFLIYIYYKKSNKTFIIIDKRYYQDAKMLMAKDKLENQNFLSVINGIYQELDKVMNQKETLIKKTGSALQQINSNITNLTDTIADLRAENERLRNRTSLLDKKNNLLLLVILLEEIRKIRNNTNNNELSYIESNVINILLSYGVIEFTVEFLDDDILKYYKFNEMSDHNNLSSYFVSQSGFYINLPDSIYVLKVASLMLKEKVND